MQIHKIRLSCFWSVCSVGPSDDEDQQEKTLSQVYDQLPEGCTPLDILKKDDERRRTGKKKNRTAGHNKVPQHLARLFILISLPLLSFFPSTLVCFLFNGEFSFLYIN